MAAKIKITVVKTVNNQELFGDNPPVGLNIAPQCELMGEGQEFIFDGRVPADLCTWGFADMQRDIVHLRLGDDYPWIKEKGTVLTCCTRWC